jgi:YidC/Oxa1 family membrane protein insertase
VNEIHAELHTHLSAAFDLADAAAAAASSTASSGSSSGFLAPLTDTLETVLKAIQTELDKLKVPYSYGYSILILTAIVKLVTLPLTKKQVGFARRVPASASSAPDMYHQQTYSYQAGVW